MSTINQVGVGLSGSTGTGTFVGANTPTLITPVIGAATGTSVVLTGKATANNVVAGFATTATAGATTTLTVSDAQNQEFTGTLTQTVVMPVTSTLAAGQQYYIINNSSGVVTVQSSGANTIQAMNGASSLLLTCVSTSGTTAASWQSSYLVDSAGVSSITGTSNQVVASASTGAVTLSLPQSIATTSAVTFGSVAFSPTTQGIVGTATNDSAGAGYVGEFVSSTISSGAPTSFTSGAVGNLTSISLTAGDWDLYGNVLIIGTTVTSVAIWISSTSASLPDASLYSLYAATTTTQLGGPAPFMRFSLSGTTTIYISAFPMGTGTLTGAGGIYARRVR